MGEIGVRIGAQIEVKIGLDLFLTTTKRFLPIFVPLFFEEIEILNIRPILNRPVITCEKKKLLTTF